MTTQQVAGPFATGQPPPSWESVAMARRAIGRAQHCDEIEIWVHHATEVVTSLVPRTGRTTSSRGAAPGFGCRVWRDGRSAALSRAVDSEHDLDLLIAETAELARWHGTPRPRPPVSTGTGQPRGPVEPRLDVRNAQAASRRAAAELAAVGAQVQVISTYQFQTIAGQLTSSGSDAVQYYSVERLVARCETPHGAITDAVARSSDDQPLALTELVGRVADELDTLAGPGVPAPADLPVVFRPPAAAAIASGVTWLLSGSTAVEIPGLGQSLGRKLFPGCLDVDDPGTRRFAQLRAIDDEGYPVRPLELIRQGRLVGFLHNVDSATALGHRPNGRGFRFGLPTQPLPQPVALRICGRGEFPADHVELSCRLDNLNVMPRTGQIEMIAAGWVVRDGVRTTRVAPFELNFDLLRYLRKIIAVGNDGAVLATAMDALVPSLAFAALP